MASVSDNDNERNDNRRQGARLPFLPPEGWIGAYVSVFSAIMVAYCAVLVVFPPEDYIGQRGAGGFRNLVNDLSFAMGPIAILSYWLTEAIRTMVFFSEKVRESRDRQRKRIKEEAHG